MKHEQNKWDSPQGWDREPCSSSIFFLLQKTQDDTVSNGDFSPHTRNGLPRYNLPLIISVALPTSSSFSFTGTVTDFKPVPPYSPLPCLTVHQIVSTVLIYRGTPPSLHLPHCLIPVESSQQVDTPQQPGRNSQHCRWSEHKTPSLLYFKPNKTLESIARLQWWQGIGPPAFPLLLGLIFGPILSSFNVTTQRVTHLGREGIWVERTATSILWAKSSRSKNAIRVATERTEDLCPPSTPVYKPAVLC